MPEACRSNNRAKKLFLGKPEIIVIGKRATYNGRIPNKSNIIKIQTWLPCKNVTEVQGFLGMAGVVRLWIRGFVEMAHLLVNSTKKGVGFKWGEEQQQAMDDLEATVISCPAIRPIDYQKPYPVILEVNSSVIATGYILSQDNEK